MPELNQLRQLVIIAESGTISKAAEIIHISQPALTRSIQKLESEWNVTLSLQGFFARSFVPNSFFLRYLRRIHWQTGQTAFIWMIWPEKRCF